MGDHEESPGWPLLFKAPGGESYEALRQVLFKRGWAELSRHHSPHEWNLTWRNPFLDGSRYRFCIKHLQRINHYEKSGGICKKDALTRNMRRMRALFKRSYAFYPTTFILPRDLRLLEKEFRSKTRAERKDNLWICKPSDGSQGSDITLVDSIEDIKCSGSMVVQKYMSDPYLIAGYKFDLRIYVLVESFKPLNVYIYREGLVRFSADKYSLDNLDNVYSHLTNSSINKKHRSYECNKDILGRGCKWTLSRLFKYLKKNSIDTEKLWLKIQDLVLLTLLPVVHTVPPMPAGFEMFGFDIILDKNMKPWLLEVNASPSISVKGDVDRKVKIPLLNNMLDVMGWNTSEYPPAAMRRSHAEAAEKSIERISSSPNMSFDGISWHVKKKRGRHPSGLKNVRSRVSTHWRTTSTPSTPCTTRRSARRTYIKPKATEDLGIPFLTCTEPGWRVDYIGNFEHIYPFSKRTKQQALATDPLGHGLVTPSSPLLSQGYDRMFVEELRIRSKRLSNSRGSSKDILDLFKRAVRINYSANLTSRQSKHNLTKSNIITVPPPSPRIRKSQKSVKSGNGKGGSKNSPQAPKKSRAPKPSPESPPLAPTPLAPKIPHSNNLTGPLEVQEKTISTSNLQVSSSGYNSKKLFKKPNNSRRLEIRVPNEVPCSPYALYPSPQYTMSTVKRMIKAKKKSAQATHKSSKSPKSPRQKQWCSKKGQIQRCSSKGEKQRYRDNIPTGDNGTHRSSWLSKTHGNLKLRTSAEFR